jgi:solute carrier family 10 (sodium/bile acid cotransporter), member 7
MIQRRDNISSVHYNPLRLLQRIGFDGFIIALLVMIMLAYLWPEGGTYSGTFSLSRIANYGVSLIFFFYGLKLNREKLRADLGNWKLHILIQASTFVVFPLVLLSCRSLFNESDLQLLWLGSFFLASLPSTVSSSVVMVSIAGGNLPAAIFNASVSSLMGVFITPLWMGWVGTTTSETIDLSDVYVKLIVQILVPVILGISLNKRWGHLAEQRRKSLRYVDQTIILIIVYTAFSESFEKRMFSNLGVLELTLLGVAMTCLFFLVYTLIHIVSRLLHFNKEDRTTALFCGSKKSLVHGTVMASVLFANSTITGILLLPLMLYHAMQLILVSFIARKIAKQEQVI